MNKDYILSVIREYADEYLREPRRHLPKGCFEKRSYQLWTIEELLKHTEEYGEASPIEAVMEFVHRMDRFSRKKGKAGFIFSIAHDVAGDILDMLLAMR